MAHLTLSFLLLGPFTSSFSHSLLSPLSLPFITLPDLHCGSGVLHNISIKRGDGEVVSGEGVLQ